MTEKDELAIYVLGLMIDFLGRDGCIVWNTQSDTVSIWQKGTTKQCQTTLRRDQFDSVISSIRENQRREKQRKS